jgi:hypothetical protein
VLEDKIKNQEDVSMKDLLSDILEKNDEISEIKGTIKKIEALLPKPHSVSEGENHFQIAMNFLVNKKGIPESEASALVERTALFEPLLPGFKVWNFYSGDVYGVYGTFVTQGDALISPNELTRQAEKEKKELIDKKDRAIAEKKRLYAEIRTLEKTRGSVISELEDLRSEREDLRDQISDLNSKNIEMQKIQKEMECTINSLSYIVDLETNLIRKDILKSVFLGSPKLKEIPSKYFTSEDSGQTMDLRTEKTIEISTKEFHLRRIKKITLYPRYYKEKKDYKVEIDANRQKATLTVLDVEKFINKRIIISVE